MEEATRFLESYRKARAVIYNHGESPDEEASKRNSLRSQTQSGMSDVLLGFKLHSAFVMKLFCLTCGDLVFGTLLLL